MLIVKNFSAPASKIERQIVGLYHQLEAYLELNNIDKSLSPDLRTHIEKYKSSLKENEKTLLMWEVFFEKATQYLNDTKRKY